MGFQEIINGEGGYSVRNKLNSMFVELFGVSAVGGLFTKVGNGQAYGTIKAALDAGHYFLMLTSDVIELTDWGIHDKQITIISDGALRRINLSVSNLGVLNIYTNNIEFVVTGTNQIFSSMSKFFSTHLRISGDNADNNFNYNSNVLSVAGIFAENVTINSGNGNLLTLIHSANNIDIVGGGTLAKRIIYLIGSIFKLNIAGILAPFVGGSGNHTVKCLSNSSIYSVENVSGHGQIELTTGCIVRRINQPMIVVCHGLLDNIIISHSDISTLYFAAYTGACELISSVCEEISGVSGIGNLMPLKNVSGSIFSTWRSQGFTIPNDNLMIMNAKFIQAAGFGKLNISGNNIRLSGCEFMQNISVTGNSCSIDGNLGSVTNPNTLTLELGVSFNNIKLRTGNGASIDVIDNSGTVNNNIVTGNSTKLT